MQYVTQRFENTKAGLAQKDAYSRKMAAQGYRVVSEQLEAGHHKGEEQCCLFAICVPCVFLAGRTPGVIIVTYGREVSRCPNCGGEVLSGNQCDNCHRIAAEGVSQASSRTAQAKEAIRKLQALLIDGTAADYRFDWNSLVKAFPTAVPMLEPESVPTRPPMLVRAALAMPFIESIFPWLMKRRLAWEELVHSHAVKRVAVIKQHERAIEEWKQSKESFDKEQATKAEEIRHLYEIKDQGALLEYWASILERPIYGTQSRRAGLTYLEVQEKLIVRYALPPISELPKVEEVKFSQQERKNIEVPFTAERMVELHRNLISNIALVVMYRLFQSDTADALDSIAFNGMIDTVDPATGREAQPCVIAVQSRKSDLMNMNFSLIDTAACLSHLGGQISANLPELSPVEPISK